MSRVRGLHARHWPRAGAGSLVLLALGALSAYAAGDASGTAAGSFLSVGAGASVLSMSGATLASGRDLAAASWNVASLAQVDALQFALSHAPLPGGATQDWLAAGGRFGTSRTRWAMTALFHQEGDIAGRDAANVPTSSLSVSDLAFGARVAQPFGNAFSAGLGAEWVHESLAGTSGSGLAFDAGVRAQAGPVGFALAARHLGGQMNYGGARYDLPGVIAAGVSWSDEARGLRFAADLESPSHYYRGVRLGGEWRWREWLALRAGYRQQFGEPAVAQVSGASFGFGTGVGSMWMDYGFTPEGSEGSGQHRIGLTFRPGFAAGGAHGHVGQPATERVPAEPRVVREPAVKREPSPPSERVPPPASVKVPESGPSSSATAPRTPTPEPTSVAAPAPPAVRTPEPSASAATSTPAASAPVPAPVVAPPVVRPEFVVVAQGESLAALARRWDTTVPALMMANNLVREQVAPGTRLKLPPARKR